MTKAYIKVGESFDEVQAISTESVNDIIIQVELDDPCIYFDKLIGYRAYTLEDKPTEYRLKFDEDKYNAYLEEKKKLDAEIKKVQKAKEKSDMIMNLIEITEEGSDKKGYNWKVYKIGDVVVKKEYIEIETVNDGSDYTKPITYKVGMSVEKGLWYTDGSDVWEALKDGTPLSFADTEYFDIVEAQEERKMKYLTSTEWWQASLIRALKTICQTLIAMIGTSQLIEQVDWKVVASSAILAGVLSILTSLAGLPEVDTEETQNQIGGY